MQFSAVSHIVGKRPFFYVEQKRHSAGPAHNPLTLCFLKTPFSLKIYRIFFFILGQIEVTFPAFKIVYKP